MAAPKLSTKRIQINKAAATMVALIATASFLTVFSLVASRALLSQRGYNSRVIKEKEAARDQLRENLKELDKLVVEYRSFAEATENVLGGNPNGTGERDGDNARLVLDALPSKYDFPALTASLEKILVSGGYTIESIAGNDQELLQQQNQQAGSTPQPVEMPFQISISGNYAAIQSFISVLERSIRPFQLSTLNLDGAESNMELSITAKTYYQPGKTLNITTKDVQ